MFNVYVCNRMVMTDIIVTYVCTYMMEVVVWEAGWEKKRGGGVGLVGVRAYEEKFQKRNRKIDYFHFFNFFFFKNLREGV